MGRIVLLRHVESEANRAGVGLGRTDSPPTALGLRQLQATVDALDREDVSAVVSSPLQRARRLAAAIAERHDAELESREELLELDVGELEGLEWGVARERYGDFLRAWRGDGSATTAMPGGESLAQVLERAWPLFEERLTAEGDGTTVMVTHNFVVKMLLSRALDMPLEAWRRIDTGLAGISVVRLAGGEPVLERLNDRSHLAGLEPLGSGSV